MSMSLSALQRDCFPDDLVKNVVWACWLSSQRQTGSYVDRIVFTVCFVWQGENWWSGDAGGWCVFLLLLRELHHWSHAWYWNENDGVLCTCMFVHRINSSGSQGDVIGRLVSILHPSGGLPFWCFEVTGKNVVQVFDYCCSCPWFGAI